VSIIGVHTRKIKKKLVLKITNRGAGCAEPFRRCWQNAVPSEALFLVSELSEFLPLPAQRTRPLARAFLTMQQYFF